MAGVTTNGLISTRLASFSIRSLSTAIMVLTAWPICLPLRPKANAIFLACHGWSPRIGIEGLLQNLLGGLLRDLFDLHATFRRCDQGVGVVRTIKRDRKVVLGLDVDACRDEQSRDGQPLRGRLGRAHAVREHESRSLSGLFDALDELDETGLSAPAGVNLSLDDHQAGPGFQNPFCLGDRLSDGFNHGSGGDRCASVMEKVSCLILVNLHSGSVGVQSRGADSMLATSPASRFSA